MDRFTIVNYQWTTGFADNVLLDPVLDIPRRLHRKHIDSSCEITQPSISEIKKIIEHNISLRVSFGWSFETAEFYTSMMSECVEKVSPNHNVYAGNMVADLSCGWLGFVPYNAFEKEVLNNLSVQELIVFNSDVIEFQTNVVKFIASHKVFLQHAFLRDRDYRYNYLRSKRKDPEELVSAFHYYIDSIKTTSYINNIPRQLVEEDIGIHFLEHPGEFFELLDFYKLTGEIYE
jgi:hypothetical protein